MATGDSNDPVPGLPDSGQPGGDGDKQNNYIVFLLDKSGSMNARPGGGTSGIAYAKSSLKAFICALDPSPFGAADRYAVLAFSNSVSTIIEGATPDTFKPKKVAGISTEDEEAIDAIKAGGSTNMNAGFAKANDFISPFIDPSTNKWAIPNRLPYYLVLSDGMWNKGGDPEDNRKKYLDYDGNLINLYVCQAGKVNTTKLNNLIGTIPDDGEYVTAKNCQGLTTAMFSAFAHIKKATPLMNKSVVMTDASLTSVPFSVPKQDGQLIVKVVWGDEKLKYTKKTPQYREAQVVLKGIEQGASVIKEPIAAGNGYAVFKVDNPEGGQWDAMFNSSGANRNSFVSLGAFYSPMVDGKTNQIIETLEVSIPKTVNAGKAITIEGKLNLPDTEIRGLQVEAHVTRPAITYEEALEKYKNEIRRISPYSKYYRVAKSKDLARLLTLQEKYLQYGRGDILPETTDLVLLTADEATGKFSGTIKNTKVDGDYTVEIKVKCADAKTCHWTSLEKRTSVTVNSSLAEERFH